MVRLFGRVQRIQDHEMKKQTTSVKSQPEARFSIAAFVSIAWGGQSSPRSGRLSGGQAPEPLIAGSNAAVSC